MADPYENTIHGLLRKRRHLLGDVDRLKKDLSCALDDIRALDRTLKALGYSGQHERMVAAGTRKVIFRRDQLRRFLIGELRHANKAVTSGELAERTMHKEGLKTTNRADREDMLKRVCQCLRLLRRKGLAVSKRDPEGCCLVWELMR
jgi:hypothetical protein